MQEMHKQVHVNVTVHIDPVLSVCKENNITLSGELSLADWLTWHFITALGLLVEKEFFIFIIYIKRSIILL